ncbi:hypothetical protein [Armatimonas rosea]|uniref:Uncharacterized protein n=1 Tax=Armatimonas rosea TaxID=685828 RepID=A0A7W9SP26_ARMRO|nr:hypothetical protein [Armatimonas rosea]MBB6050151.1 hypothetical protein [Armatimonas rosea]
MDLLCSANQTVTIDFRSYGDGGFYSYLFTYHPAPRPYLSVREKAAPFLPNPSPEPLADVLLTPAQVQRLQNLIRYYRLPHGSGCTQLKEVAITWLKGDLVLGEEHYKDESCASGYLLDASPHDLAVLHKSPKGRAWRNLPPTPVLSLSRVGEQAKDAAQKGKQQVWLRDIPHSQTEAAIEIRSQRQEEQNTRAAEKRLHRLPGFARLDAQYLLSDFDQSSYMFLESLSKEGAALSMTLKPRRRKRIDQFDWYIPLVHGKPKLTGETFLRQAKRLTDSVASLDWLDRWRQAAPGRTIEATLYGESFLNPDTSSDDPHTLWKTAGLSGSPFAVLTLRRADPSYLSLAVGANEKRSLVLLNFLSKSEQECQAHPLDSLGREKAVRGIVRQTFLLDAQGRP